MDFQNRIYQIKHSNKRAQSIKYLILIIRMCLFSCVDPEQVLIEWRISEASKALQLSSDSICVLLFIYS